MAALFSDSESTDQIVYRSTVRTIRDRLDLLGYSRAESTAVINDRWIWRLYVEDETDNISAEELIRDFSAHLLDPPVDPWDIHNPQAKRFSDQLGYIWGEDRRMLKFIVDRLPDDTEVCLDLSQVTGLPSVEPSATFCSTERASEIESAIGALPTIVLVEGSTDTEFLRAALELRRPDLLGFITFMDYGMKPSGGVTNVVQGIRSLAAAGVGNRVLALMDNDAAGVDGMRQLATTPLPKNMKATLLPDVPRLHSYPAIGPDGPSATNISGRAAALELYLGADVLTNGSGYVPVQWTSYLKQVAAYQGEIIEKSDVKQRFRNKVSKIRAGGPMVEADWVEMDAVIDHIVQTVRSM